MDYDKEYKEFSRWWGKLTEKSVSWTALERMAAKGAWLEAKRRSETKNKSKQRRKDDHDN